MQGRQWAWAFNYAVPLGTELSESISPDLAETEIHLKDSSLVVPFMTLKIGVEHMRVVARTGDVVTVDRAVNGTVADPTSRPASEVMRVFNGTDTVAEGRLQAADNTPIVTVPVGQMIRFNIASADVLHAFYTPQFLTKLDAVPGRVQTLWVRITDSRRLHEPVRRVLWSRPRSDDLHRPRTAASLSTMDWFEDKAGERARANRGRLSAAKRKSRRRKARSATRPTARTCSSALGCNVCHGDQGEGLVGPTIAMTIVPLDRVITQYREPLEAMQVFPPDKVSDEEIADIYAWLQTVPRPPEADVIPSKLAELIEAGG